MNGYRSGRLPDAGLVTAGRRVPRFSGWVTAFRRHGLCAVPAAFGGNLPGTYGTAQA